MFHFLSEGDKNKLKTCKTCYVIKRCNRLQLEKSMQEYAIYKCKCVGLHFYTYVGIEKYIWKMWCNEKFHVICVSRKRQAKASGMRSFIHFFKFTQMLELPLAFFVTLDFAVLPFPFFQPNTECCFLHDSCLVISFLVRLPLTKYMCTELRKKERGKILKNKPWRPSMHSLSVVTR